MDAAQLLAKSLGRPASTHPVDVGLRTEAIITAELVRRGISVLQPCGFNHRYDLVLDLDGEYLRAQCKTGRLRKGVVRFKTESVTCNTRSARRRGYVDEIDLFLVYCPGTSEIYAVPLADAATAEAALRVAATSNGQEVGVRWAADYVLPA